ncbi:hypothetical protein [Thermogemmatispora sp.]|uniref:hypothetical protein n=1 Tax=Thermogemmatispora sp. TaxID=1968838 RepID=UPI0035E445A3
MMGNAPDWRQQIKIYRRQARQQARAYRQQARAYRQQVRAYRRQQRLYMSRFSLFGGLSTACMLLALAGIVYAFISEDWKLLLAIFFGGLAVSSFFKALSRGHLLAGVNSLIWLVATALLVWSGSWSWFLLALLLSIIVSSLGPYMWGSLSCGVPEPPETSPTFAESSSRVPEATDGQAAEPASPPYTPYHQGYQAQTAVSESPVAPAAVPEEPASTKKRYTQPLLSYPEEGPQVLPPQQR